MRRLLPLLLVALAACPPPFEPDCQRLLVDTTGNVRQGIGGGPSANNLPPPGLAGSSATITFFAPLSSCVSDTLRAEVSVLDPDNLPVAIEPAGDPVRVGVEGAVRLAVTFTPTRPGLHALRVAFEPSLGARALLLDVASDGLAGLTTRVPIPTGANCRADNALWALTDDTVACEQSGNGLVSITSADGGSSEFAGAQLVVVDTVLWSINPATSTLERRVFEDGGVRITNTFPNFPSVSTPAMHDVDLALRFRANGDLTLVRLTPNGNTVRELPLGGQPGPPLAYFAEANDDVFRWSSVEVCSFCLNLPDVAAVEPGYVWRAPSVFDQAPRTPRVLGYTRPTLREAAPRFTLLHSPEPVATPANAFERLPLWLSTAVPGKRLLLSVEDDAPRFTAWPAGEVLRVGRHHVVLLDPELAFVRVVRR